MPQTKEGDNLCPDCDLPRPSHVHNWVGGLVDFLFPKFISRLSRRLDRRMDAWLPKIFIALGLARFEENFPLDKVERRAALFIATAREQGAAVSVLRTRFGYTGHFRLNFHGRMIYFDNLPIADFANSRAAQDIDDKEVCKKILRAGGFPVLPSKPFWFWQKEGASRFAREIGFPVVVKPRAGSVSRHVTTNIVNLDQLQAAIDSANEYSPQFLVEKYLDRCFVHRATIIDGDFVACAKQLPAHVLGNDHDSIAALIEQKNADPRRDDKFYHKLVADKSFLLGQGLTTAGVPSAGQTVFLQKDPFMRYGGDIAEVTAEVHPDNVKLFADIAKYFGIKVIGMDFLINDISKSWREDPCAVLELNTVPCIEMHHLPILGSPQNPAQALFKMVLKYYL